MLESQSSCCTPVKPFRESLAEATLWRAMAWRCVGTIIASVLGWWWHDRLHSVSTAFFMVGYLLGAWDLAKTAWSDFQQKIFDTHFLMILVVPCTAAIGAWGEGALLLILFSLSAVLESYALGRTHRAIHALLHGAPKTHC
ncbi:MAG: hypothetical protein HC845_11980 [Akkermansiaceae bacterium]|nr:hypothetical protein [Akkermansiaceae bacterium]